MSKVLVEPRQWQFTHRPCEAEPVVLPDPHPSAASSAVAWGAASAAAPSLSGAFPRPASEKDPYRDLSDTMLEPWLEPSMCQARRQSLDLNDSKKAAFMENCEFVSLGNFCGVARALQALDAKNKAYPFDWVRSPVEGVIRSLETDFEDFLTFSMEKDDPASKLKVFTESRWGGSFWHHNPCDPKTKDDFTRRIERLLGVGDIGPSKTRVFVRAVNSTNELEATTQLHRALQRALPEARVYLLVLIDFQLEAGPLRLAGDRDTSRDLLFYRIHERAFATLPWSMERVCDAYAEAIAFAVGAWCGREGSDDAVALQTGTVASLKELNALCDQFHGGSPGSDGFWPRRFQGQQITLAARKRPSVSLQLPGLLAPAAAAGAQSLPTLLPAPPVSSSWQEDQRLPTLLASPSSSWQEEQKQEQIAELRIPAGITPGRRFDADAFGGKVNVEVPRGAMEGQLLRLRLMEGVVTTALLTTTCSATLSHVATATATAQAAKAAHQAATAAQAEPFFSVVEELFAAVQAFGSAVQAPPVSTSLAPQARSELY